MKAAAPVSGKGNNRLPAEIIFLQESIQRHREIRVPVGIAKENHIIAVQVLNLLYPTNATTTSKAKTATEMIPFLLFTQISSITVSFAWSLSIASIRFIRTIFTFHGFKAKDSCTYWLPL